ncbi:MAG: LysR family transcriptional regulator [Pseudomonadota bacterium]
MKLGLRHIRYFVAVAEELHFRRAAERLGIAQPALSRSIKALEQDLGVTLFTRNNRSVQITTAGRTFLQGCHGITNAIEHTIDQTRLANSGQIGSLRIGYTDNAIAGALPDVLKAFQDQWPHVILRPFHGTTITQLRKLDKGELDIGFVTGPISHSGYEQTPIQSERFVCVTYAGHRLARRGSIRLEQLADENFVHGSSDEWKHFYAYLIPICRRAGFVPRIVQEAFNTAGILGLVASGMGVTILAESATAAINPNLSVIPIEDVSEELQTVVIWKSDNLIGPKKVFVDHMRQR